MSMSKSDFWAMADALASVKPERPEKPTTRELEEYTHRKHVWKQCVSAIQSACAGQYTGSYGFQHELFQRACNGEG